MEWEFKNKEDATSLEIKQYSGRVKGSEEFVQGSLNYLAKYDAYFIFATYYNLLDGQRVPVFEVEGDSIEEI